MKRMLLNLTVVVGFVTLAAAADVAWPSDYDAKVAARETARQQGIATVDIVQGALDAREAGFVGQVWQDQFHCSFLERYVTEPMAYDPTAVIGFLLFIR